MATRQEWELVDEVERHLQELEKRIRLTIGQLGYVRLLKTLPGVGEILGATIYLEIGEVRRFFDGPIVLSGAITTGDAILAALAAGADLAYIGTRFLATPEASVPERYKEEILKAAASDIVYTDLFSGVHGNYLKHSVIAAGFDPLNLPKSDPSKMNFGAGSGAEKKVWRDIWSAGQGVGQIDDIPATAELVVRLRREYDAARARLAL